MELTAGSFFTFLFGLLWPSVNHGAFKTSVNAAGSKMDHLLRSLYIFRLPSKTWRLLRNNGFTSFPTSVLLNTLDWRCSCDRAIRFGLTSAKTLKTLKKKSNRPTNVSYRAGVIAVIEDLTLPKLHVFSAIAKCFPLFLEAFVSFFVPFGSF